MSAWFFVWPFFFFWSWKEFRNVPMAEFPRMNPHGADLFISYNAEESAWVEKAISSLESQLQILENGQLRPFRCFVDMQDITAGDDWHATMLANAVSAFRFLFVISPKALASDWCQLELHQRINSHPQGLDTLLFVNRREGLAPMGTEIGVLTRYRRWVDVSNARPFEKQIDELSAWLCRKKEYEDFQVIRKADKANIFAEPLALEEAFRRFVPCVGIVTKSRYERPLGYAWLNQGRQFLCDYETARAIRNGPQGHALRLCWRDDWSGAGGSLIIARVEVPHRRDEAGKLYVSLNAPLPNRPCLGRSLEYFTENEVGTVVFEASAETKGESRLVPRRAVVSNWLEPAGIEMRMEAGEILLSGAPLFDALGCFAGCVTSDDHGASVALPREIFSQ
jgi:hypothetical protein